MSYYLYTEWLLVLRRSQTWLYPLCFFAIVICLFPLAFTPDPTFLQKYVPGCIWIAALLAGLLSVENIFFSDTEDGYLEQLLLSGIPLSETILAKLAVHWLIAELPLILLTPIIGLFFNLSFKIIITLCVSLLVGTPAILMTSTLAAALSLSLQKPGALLGVLILPLVIPVLIFGVNITQQLQAGFSILAPLAFLAGISLLSMAFMPWVIASALRVSLDD